MSFHKFCSFGITRSRKIAPVLTTIMCNFSSQVPLSLTGSPTAALVPPGQCQFNDEFQGVKLMERTKVSPTSFVLKFGLPNESKPMDLSTCACILAKASVENESDPVIRPYTPISTNKQIGSFDLLIKDYGSQGKMSKHLCEDISIGDTVEFKHIDFNVKLQAPFKAKKIGMLVGGTGITPMIQALHAILGDKDSKQEKVSMLYGSRVSTDILGGELLDLWAKQSNGKFDMQHVLSHEPEGSDWKGERGYINADMIRKYMPSPDEEDIIIFVCGPPPMYDAFCGPRDQKELSGILADLGYKAEQVYKF